MNIDFKKSIVIAAISAIVGGIITGLFSLLIFSLGNYTTQDVLEKQVVENLSNYFDTVDSTMKYEEALYTAQSENSGLKQELNEYKKEVADKQDIIYYDPILVKNNIPIQSNSPKNVVYIDERLYISEQAISSLYGKPIIYNDSENVLYFNENSENDDSIMVNLLDTNVLYDGVNHTIYKPTDGNSFSVGGTTYTSGFDINTRGGNEGYVLLNLNNTYSSIIFDVGRVDGTDKHDITLDIYINDEIYQTYNISPDTPSTHFDIPLDYAKSMKLHFRVPHLARESLGFTNIYLKK